MTDFIYYLAEGEALPLEEQINPLLPKSYDIVWSIVHSLSSWLSSGSSCFRSSRRS